MRRRSVDTARALVVAFALLAGTAGGVGVVVFGYAHGASYLSRDPSACVNCHIMQPQHDGWQKASHHAVAVCVDCHLPAEGFSKWWAKAVNGWNHARGFTLQDFHEPIRLTPANDAILQRNCLRCHGDLVHGLEAGTPGERDALRCVHCHRDVGHGPRAGLGGPDRGAAAERRALDVPAWERRRPEMGDPP